MRYSRAAFAIRDGVAALLTPGQAQSVSGRACDTRRPDQSRPPVRREHRPQSWRASLSVNVLRDPSASDLVPVAGSGRQQPNLDCRPRPPPGSQPAIGVVDAGLPRWWRSLDRPGVRQDPSRSGATWSSRPAVRRNRRTAGPGLPGHDLHRGFPRFIGDIPGALVTTVTAVLARLEKVAARVECGRPSMR